MDIHPRPYYCKPLRSIPAPIYHCCPCPIAMLYPVEACRVCSLQNILPSSPRLRQPPRMSRPVSEFLAELWGVVVSFGYPIGRLHSQYAIGPPLLPLAIRRWLPKKTSWLFECLEPWLNFFSQQRWRLTREGDDFRQKRNCTELWYPRVVL